MATLRDIQRRIQSVKKTAQITKAMQMVAAARLRRMQEALESTRPYADKMAQVVGDVVGHGEEGLHPLTEQRPGPRRLRLLVLSTDRGLCGGLNSNLFRMTRDLLAEGSGRYGAISLYLVGQKAVDHYKRREVEVAASSTHLFSGRPDFAGARMIAADLMKAFLEGEVDEVGVVFTRFHSMLSQRASHLTLLPLEPGEGAGGEGEEASEETRSGPVDYIYEPSREALLERLLPRYVEVELFWMLLEAQTSELAARMTAMDNATNNAHEMIDRLTLTFNRARQAAITKELMDIVSGAEALR